ncbi:2-methoxy-6-polyprenyl-1,4-benzoquinol methylase, mitochondrial [Holothuria leucospilota]|uniref:2-methoxy-6-polyprenyl-1,4-benzoquinol methylase, mitochondrial n=1 Tax=Holothuria leucospilota TaxID=206669 RepID=A0A9Q1BMX3_HOLLE|nr:2-methoxy-6-polyprenyl-1,4-benzoquinol methylase, mitochondrial [Holothuria leucospilota]
MESSEDFAARMNTVLVHACTSMSISVGYEVGLFDLLAGMKEPKTSQEIADAGDLKERYVREWLGAMVCAKIVELDSTGEKYYLPPSRAQALTTDGPLADAVLEGLLLPTLGGEVYSRVRECFKKDGPRGVSQDHYSDTHRVIGQMTKGFHENLCIPGVVYTYPELRDKLEKGIIVLDIGCGQGVSTITHAKTFPNSTFYGVDFLEESLKPGKEKADNLGLKNVKFLAYDAAKLPEDWDEKFDYVFMHDALHDQAYPDKVLREVYRVLSPGGIYLALEPKSYTKVKDNLEKLEGIAILYTLSLMHCMPTSLFFEGGMGLGAAWGREKAVEMITEAGLEVDQAALNEKGIGQHFYCKKPSGETARKIQKV